MSVLNKVKSAAEAEEIKKQNSSSKDNFYSCKMVVRTKDETGQEVEVVLGYFNIFKNASIVKTIANAIEIKYPEINDFEFEEKVVKALNLNLPKWGYSLELLEDRPKLDIEVDLEGI